MSEFMDIIENPPRDSWKELLKRPELDSGFLDKTIEDIFEAVKKRGDAALLDFTSTFDGVDLSKIKVSNKELKKVEKEISTPLKEAIANACVNIEKFHSAQNINEVRVQISPGVVCWQKPVAIERVGLYIPGGNAPLFSSVLMLAIPAKIAGCKEIVLCTPPGKDGKANPAVIYAASVVGIDEVYTIGGAQAIAAMAFGTETIKPVNKIFGPGNQFVTAAKQEVQKHGVAIDLPAGPSEVLVMADETADPGFVASDLLSQAEHGSDSPSILLTNSRRIAEESIKALENQLEEISRKDLLEESLKYCKVILLDSVDKIMEMSNFYAPEHLIISMKNAVEISNSVVNAGSVFIGNYAPESAGDYASGTNHTLPTNGFAKAYSGVNLDSFVKKITFQEITSDGLKSISPTIEAMAEAENLEAHKNAVSIRIKKLNE